MEKMILKMMALSFIIILSISTQVLAIQDDFEVKSTNIKVADNVADFNEVNPDKWKPDPVESNKDFNDIIGKILGSIRNIGTVVSVIALMIIGLRTMYGSIEEKSHYKELLPTFLIGVFILFASTTIPDIIYRVIHE